MSCFSSNQQPDQDGAPPKFTELKIPVVKRRLTTGGRQWSESSKQVVDKLIETVYVYSDKLERDQVVPPARQVGLINSLTPEFSRKDVPANYIAVSTFEN